MHDTGKRGASLAILVLVFLLFSPTAALSIVAGEEPSTGAPVRYSNLVKFDILSTRIYSEGVSSWGFYVIGRLNATTTVQTRLVNQLDAPLEDVEIKCTVYWYDGNYPDRGEVMHLEKKLIDIPKGDGTYSDFIRFVWVPTFTGAYIVNLSAHVPGDPRSMSTDPLFFQGVKYQPHPVKYFWSGCWVASEYWNCSSFEGWEAESVDGDPRLGWRPYEHPLGVAETTEHSAPMVFWAGNSSTQLAPLTGHHSLITPVLNLTRFDPDPYDVEMTTRRPQIFFLYRYRGNVTADGLYGKAGLFHQISIDDGETWEPLNDTKGVQVVLAGNTTGDAWAYARRPFYNGEGGMIGLDLAAYQGKEVKIKMEYYASGLPETGYLLDDFALIGMELVQQIPFVVTSVPVEVPRVDPGSKVSFSFNITSNNNIEETPVRISCLNASGMIDPYRDVVIQPEVLVIPSMTSVSNVVNVSFDVPKGERSGNWNIWVRAAGSGIIRDIELSYQVKARHQLDSTLIGPVSGGISPETPLGMEVRVENEGNIDEIARYSFVTGSDLVWDGTAEEVGIGPGQVHMFVGNISIAPGALAGVKTAFIVISNAVLPSDDELLNLLRSNQTDPQWDVYTLEYICGQRFSVQVISSSSNYRSVEEPPDNGTLDITYYLFVTNQGNGPDEVSFMSTGSIEGSDVDLTLPGPRTIRSGATEIIEIDLELIFPIPVGIYNFTVSAVSSGEEDTSDNSAELVLSIGSPPVSSGIYLLKGSLLLPTGDLILGEETVLAFTARAFGFLKEGTFNVNLEIDGQMVSTKQFPISRYQDKVYQMVWTFDEPGHHEVGLALSERHDPMTIGEDLVSELTSNTTVRYIDISISDMSLDEYGVPGENETVRPGDRMVIAKVTNLGDINADLFSLVLKVSDIKDPLNRTEYIVNTTDLEPNGTVTVRIKVKDLSRDRVYELSMMVDNRGRWKDLDESNDLQTMTITTGGPAGDRPIWRKGPWATIVLVISFLVLLAMFIYLLRKKI